MFQNRTKNKLYDSWAYSDRFRIFRNCFIENSAISEFDDFWFVRFQWLGGCFRPHCCPTLGHDAQGRFFGFVLAFVLAKTVTSCSRTPWGMLECMHWCHLKMRQNRKVALYGYLKIFFPEHLEMVRSTLLRGRGFRKGTFLQVGRQMCCLIWCRLRNMHGFPNLFKVLLETFEASRNLQTNI